MLGKGLRKYVIKEKKGYDKQTRYVYDSRLKKATIQGLKDLALLADKLPEKEQAEIFNKENMTPFLRNVFDFLKKTDDLPKTRKRIITLWNVLFTSEAVSYTYARTLVGKEVMRALTLKPLQAIHAIYYATQFIE